jgi:hypothetical protein
MHSNRRTVSRDLEVFYPENRYLNFYLSPVAEEGEADLGHVMLGPGYHPLSRRSRKRD